MIITYRSNQPPTEVNLLTVRIIWGAILISHLLLLVLIKVVKLPSLPPEVTANLSFTPEAIRQAFLNHLQLPTGLPLTAAAFGAVGAALFVPAAIYRARVAQRNQAVPTQASPESGIFTFDLFMIRIALLESVSLVGFMKAFVLPGDPLLIFPFLLVGVGLHLTQFPRDRNLGFRDPESYHGMN
jgi:hypothetical protein